MGGTDICYQPAESLYNPRHALTPAGRSCHCLRCSSRAGLKPRHSDRARQRIKQRPQFNAAATGPHPAELEYRRGAGSGSLFVVSRPGGCSYANHNHCALSWLSGSTVRRSLCGYCLPRKFRHTAGDALRTVILMKHQNRGMQLSPAFNAAARDIG